MPAIWEKAKIRSQQRLLLSHFGKQPTKEVPREKRPTISTDKLIRDASKFFFSITLGLNIVFSPPPSDYLPTIGTTPLAFAADESKSIVSQVGELVEKYYVDRSFNGQSWMHVRQKYEDLERKKSDDDSYSLKLATEMVKLLGDKYSRILDVDQYAAIQKYDLIGVGVTLMPNDSKDIVVGAPPVKGSASALAGLKMGDYVTAINGIPTKGRTAFDIINQISEKPNAQSITMSVVSSDKKGGDASPVDIELKRTFQEVKDPVIYKVSETRPDGTKVGYVRITEFNALVKGSLERALDKLENEGVNAYVLDLRRNTGGAFQSAVEISSLFMEDRVATYVLDSSQARLPFRTPSGRLGIEPSDALVVWIDGFTASAAEVLAGSLHDNCRAVLAGKTSFGKGLIQAVYGLNDGAGLVLTVAKYVTPGGTDIQGKGIEPDIGSSGVPQGLLDLSSDTSKVDFDQIRRMLSSPMCMVPETNTI